MSDPEKTNRIDATEGGTKAVDVPENRFNKTTEGPPRTSDTTDLKPPTSAERKGEKGLDTQEAPSRAVGTDSAKIDRTDAERDIEGGRKIEPESGNGTKEHIDKDADGTHKRSFYQRHRIFFHIFIFLLFTAWLIVGLIKHHESTSRILKPTLLWLAITLRLIFFWAPASMILRPFRWLWRHSVSAVHHVIPGRFRMAMAGLLVVSVILIGAFATEETPNNQRRDRAVSMFGLIVFIAGLYATSRNRKAIQWQTVIVGMLVQFIIALFVLRTEAGYDIFNFISEMARDLLGFAKQGLAFLFDEDMPNRPWLVVSVLPAIIFFISLIQLLFYYGIIQWFVLKFSTFFFWSMKVSGAEAVVATASPFIGQGESAILVKPFMEYFTLAEIHQIMCSGFATIAGSVLIAYISFGVNPQALISSCVMSIPASLAVSKLRFPEEEESITAGRIVIPENEAHEQAANALHAFAQGAWLGLKVAGTIAANLLVIISLVALIDGLLGWWGSYFDISNPRLSLTMLAGYVCYPVAFLLGVPRNELYPVGQLLGEKFIINEFKAYTDLTSDKYSDLSGRSVLITTYALASFANLGSLGIQIGVLSQICPSRAGDVSRVAISALLSGSISTLTSATIAGMLVTDEGKFIINRDSS